MAKNLQTPNQMARELADILRWAAKAARRVKDKPGSEKLIPKFQALSRSAERAIRSLEAGN